MKTIKLNRETIIVGSVAATALLIGGGFAMAGVFSPNLKDKVQAEFPNTPITSVSCDKGPANLCEAVAGQNVFYVTRDGKYAFVGAVLDLENKVDMTDARLRELAAVGQAESKINGGTVPTAAGARAAAPSGPAPAGAPGPVIRVTLPKENAIVHNPGAALKMTVFTDMNCHFCRQLHNDLKSVTDIEITEYPIAFMAPDSADKAKLALCSKDRSKGVDAIYGGGEVVTSGDCAAAERAVAANTEFARQNNITGTPTIIRADGTSNSGWMPTAELRAFLGGAK
jgi:thiol:disulfide interchange protein DsbC